MDSEITQSAASITVVHGRSKHVIQLRETLGQLRQDISSATGFSADEFTIIIGGRKLSQPDETPLSSIGVVHGKTAMISVSRSAVANPKPRLNLSESTPLGKVRKLDAQLDELDAELKAVEEQIRKHTMGFLDYEKTLEALQRDVLATKGVEEKCMQVIEKLDSVSIDSASYVSGDVLRAERKSAVMKAQRILKQCDIVRDKIEMFSRDEFDEVKSRRGKG